MSDPKLEPCPFCGSAKTRDDYDDYNRDRVFCDDCGAAGPVIGNTREEVITRWNTRVTPWRRYPEERPEELDEIIVLLWGKPMQATVTKKMLSIDGKFLWLPLPQPPKEGK